MSERRGKRGIYDFFLREGHRHRTKIKRGGGSGVSHPRIFLLEIKGEKKTGEKRNLEH